MLTELPQPWNPPAGASDALKLVHLRSLSHKQAVDLFYAAKTKIVERALSSQDSIRLLGSIKSRDANRAVRSPAIERVSSEPIEKKSEDMS